MRRWTRWQDWAALVVGVYAFLSPIWTSTTSGARYSLIVLGVILAVTALWSLAFPGALASEYVHAGLGVLLFISPWVLGFAGLATAMAWTAWITGGIALIVGLWAALPTTRLSRRKAVPQH